MASTPGSVTPSTSAGSSPPPWTAGALRGCSTATRPNDGPAGTGHRGRRREHGVLSTDLVSDALEDDGPGRGLARRGADAHIQATKHAEFHALELVLDVAYESTLVLGDGARLRHAWLGGIHSV